MLIDKLILVMVLQHHNFDCDLLQLGNYFRNIIAKSGNNQVYVVSTTRND